MTFDLSAVLAAVLRMLAPKLSDTLAEVLGDLLAAAAAAVTTLVEARGRMDAASTRALVEELLDDALGSVPGWKALDGEDREAVVRAAGVVASLLASVPPRRRVRMRADVVQALAGDPTALIARFRSGR